MKTHRVLVLVSRERERQNQLWPNWKNRTSSDYLPIIMEELGEVAKAHLENKLKEYVEELIQTAACCVAAIEAITEQFDHDIPTKENRTQKET